VDSISVAENVEVQSHIEVQSPVATSNKVSFVTNNYWMKLFYSIQPWKLLEHQGILSLWHCHYFTTNYHSLAQLNIVTLLY
jgi:hypothetical protein